MTPRGSKAPGPRLPPDGGDAEGARVGGLGCLRLMKGLDPTRRPPLSMAGVPAWRQFGGAKNSRAMPSGSRKPEPGSVGSVLDLAVGDSQFVESARPLLELVTIGSAEGGVVKSDAELR
jgi:hypothetical protein